MSVLIFLLYILPISIRGLVIGSDDDIGTIDIGLPKINCT